MFPQDPLRLAGDPLLVHPRPRQQFGAARLRVLLAVAGVLLGLRIRTARLVQATLGGAQQLLVDGSSTQSHGRPVHARLTPASPPAPAPARPAPPRSADASRPVRPPPAPAAHRHRRPPRRRSSSASACARVQHLPGVRLGIGEHRLGVRPRRLLGRPARLLGGPRRSRRILHGRGPYLVGLLHHQREQRPGLASRGPRTSAGRARRPAHAARPVRPPSPLRARSSCSARSRAASRSRPSPASTRSTCSGR